VDIGEHEYKGTVGMFGQSNAKVKLHFAATGHVTGTAKIEVEHEPNVRLRLEGAVVASELVLRAYSQDKQKRETLTANLRLKRTVAGATVRWTGTSHNTPPDSRILQVSITETE
jgi:hypothetical protein